MINHFNKIILILLVQILISSKVDAQLSIISPVEDGTYVCGETVRIEWTGNLQYSASLYYSTDDGLTWNLIASGITADFYDWSLPFFDRLNVKLRIENDKLIPPYLIHEFSNAHDAEIRSVGFSPDGSSIVSASRDSKVKIWNLASFSETSSYDFGDTLIVYYASFYGDKDFILVAVDSGLVLWDVLNSSNNTNHGAGALQKFVGSCFGNKVKNELLAVSYDSPYLKDGKAVLLDANNGTVKAKFMFSDSAMIRFANYSKDYSKIVITGDNGGVEVFDITTGNSAGLMTGHGDSPGVNVMAWCADISPDNKQVVTCGLDRTVRLWDISSNSQSKVLLGHRSHVRSVKYHPSGQYCISGSLDSTIRLWDLNSGLQFLDSLPHLGQVLDVNYSPTGDSFVSAGRNNSIRLWRNFQYIRDYDTISFNALYPLTVKVPHIVSKHGKVIRIPLLLERNIQVPEPMGGFFSANVNLVIPNKILNLESNELHSGYLSDNDTVYLNLQDKSLSDTLHFLKTRVLYLNKDTIAPIEISLFESIDLSDYQLNLENGSISLNLECPADTLRQLEILDEPLSLNVAPNPASAFIEIRINVLEDGIYTLDLLNNNGILIKRYLNTYLNQNIYYFSIKFDDISNGGYFLSLKLGNKVATEKIIINK